jgi:flagellar hook-associated protein 3 FlgL
LRIVNGNQTYVIDTSTANTVEDLLNLLNGSGANVLAEVNAAGTGIDVRSRLSGSDFSIGENGGTTATQLGIRSLTGNTLLSDLNFGRGVSSGEGTDFTIHRRDGYDLAIDTSSAVTVQNVIDLINNDPNNQDPTNRVVARLASVGNGIELVDSNTLGPDTLNVTQPSSSNAAVDLGLIPTGSVAAVAGTSGSDQVLTGRDTNPQEVQGVFNTLIRLRDAIQNGDLEETGRLSAKLDGDLDRVNFARSDLGQRAKTLDTVGTRLDDDEVELKGSLSKEIDVDLLEAISNLTARQASLQASLQLTGKTFALSLMDYL